MYGGAIFKHIEKDKFLVTNAGDGKDIDNVVVKLTLKDLKSVLSAYGVDTKRKKKQELLDDFIKVSKNMTVEPKPVPPKKPRAKSKQPVKFEPMEEMMDFAPTPKNVQIKKPVKFVPLEEAMMDAPKPKNVQIKKPFRLSPELERASDPTRLSQLLPIRSERENELLEMEEEELKDIISDNEIKFKGDDKRAMIDAILRHEGIPKGASLSEAKYNDLQTMHNVLNLKNRRGDRSLYVIYRALEDKTNNLAQKRKQPLSERDTSQEYFDEFGNNGMKGIKQRISDVEEILLKDGFNKKTKAAPKAKKDPVKFEPMEEMMDTAPTPKNVQIKKPEPKPRYELLRDGKYPHAFTPLLEQMEKLKDDKSFDEPIVNIDREYALFEMKKPELVKIAKTYKIKSTLKVNDMIDAILEAEKLPRVVKPTGDKSADRYAYIKLEAKYKALTKERRSNIYDELVDKMLKYDKDVRDKKLDDLRKRSDRRTDISSAVNDALIARRRRLTGEGIKRKGGSISAKDLKGLHASSYKQDPDKEVNGWVLDEDISKPTARVYFNASKNQAIVVHRGTEATVKDWANNAFFVAGLSPLTQRYKDSKEVQEKAENKYSDVLTTGHSQGSSYTQLAKNKKGIIDVNPSSFLQSTEGTTVRSASDPVSALRGIANMFSKKGKENITTSAKVNPLDAHSINILDELGDKELGTGLTKYLKGLHRGKKGKGSFEDFFKKTLPRVLVKQGIPLALSIGASSLGSIGGPITGVVAGEAGAKAGQLLADDISKKAGYGMKGGYLGQNPFPRSFGGGMTRHLKSLGK